jgi:hypothetical protein
MLPSAPDPLELLRTARVRVHSREKLTYFLLALAALAVAAVVPIIRNE